MKHKPVLLDSVMNVLGDVQGKVVIDATFGAGGYTRAFLNAGANVIAFDRDPNVLSDAIKIQTEFGSRFKFIQSSFSEIGKFLNADDVQKIYAVVFDFGISSMQIDNAERGFSFRFDGPLDMRMESVGVTASELVENSTAAELEKILREYGELKKAKILARAIKDARPKTTIELKNLIHNPNDVAPVFQALRIAVNDELGQIKNALNAVDDLLQPGGICACVSFHSLEDRIVKNVFRDWTTVPGDPRLPVVAGATARFENLTRGGIAPDAAELCNNPRARSARLRAVRKISG